MKTTLTILTVFTVSVIGLSAQTTVPQGTSPIRSAAWTTAKSTPPLRALRSREAKASSGFVRAGLPARSTPVATRVAEIGPHHRVVHAVSASTNEQGRVLYRTNEYTQLETGLNVRQPDGTWAEASDEIELTPDGAAAMHTQHKVIFPADIAAGAIEILTPEGRLLRSPPSGIGYFSPATGQSVLVGVLKSSVGVLSKPNRVTYPDCLRGDIRADLVCTVTKAGFESDLVIRAQPLSWPADYGFAKEEGVRLQLFTEFFDAPEPGKQPQWLDQRADLVDETLDFVGMLIIRGKAFPSGDPESDTAVPVSKQWIQVDQRRFLLEQIPLERVTQQLHALPKGTAAFGPREEDPILRRISTERLLPRTEMARATTNLMTLASLPPEEAGFVMDWYLTLSSGADKTLQGDTKYYCSGPVYFTGVTTIEGGTCVKFAVCTPRTIPSINILGSVDCKTGPYRPAIFTAKDDDTVGGIIGDSTGIVQGKYGDGLGLSTSGGVLKHLRFCHASSAIRLAFSEGQIGLAHLQFVHCLYGVDFNGNSENTVNADNCLFYSITNVTKGGADNYLRGRHLTVDHCLKLFKTSGNHNGEVHLTNSILAEVVNLGNADAFAGSHNGFFNSPTFGSDFVVEAENEYPFAPVGYLDGGEAWYFVANAQGAHYLRDGSPFVDAGTLDITQSLKDDLCRTTTVVPELFNHDVNSSQTLGPTPIRDTDTPDLGYHYPVVDYVVCGATVNNCTLNIDQGTVLALATPYAELNGRTEAVRLFAWYEPVYEWGIRLNPGGRLNVNGVPTNRVVFPRLDAIQEFPVFLPNYGWGPLITFKGVILPTGTIVSPLAEARVRYADFTALAGNYPTHFGDMYYDSTYDLVQTLEVEGCCLQNGWFVYETGGVAGRTIALRNNIFDR